MKTKNLYSEKDITTTYEQVYDLLLTRYIIKNYSTNKKDIRDIALHGLNCKKTTKVLELGCGYGFFIEKLKGKLHDYSVIIGIDMVENNREPFLHSVSSIQYKGEFIAGNADIIKQMANASFDMIITSYSLYFFPDLIPEISRILAPDGVFIAITHSKNTLQEAIYFIISCMNSLGYVSNEEIRINKLFSAFSMEDGKHQLEKYFNMIERLDYNNSMIFKAENINDLIFYIQQKKNLIYKDVFDLMPDTIDAMLKCVENKLLEHIKIHGSIVLNKDDAVFRCYKPQ